MYNFRTDLALERREILEKQSEKAVDGIEVEEKEISDRIKVTKVKVTNENGENAIGKPKGTYITVDVKKLKIATEEEIEDAANTVAEALKELVCTHIEREEDVLVVGLGNEYVTPDSLRTKGYCKHRSYKACNKIYARICNRRNKTYKCDITSEYLVQLE